jgi:LAO/AO transport system kinase
MGGDRRALACLITLVENADSEAQAALRELYAHTGHAHTVGITGAPGSGKSTLINQLARELRHQGASVGIVAVDPSSPFSGGALLGDRVRMRDLAGDPGVFIRSMATRGHLGGLAGATQDVIKILDAVGFGYVLIETIGVGQSEVDIARTAHTTVLVESPGMGDDVQALKAGVVEIADILVVNKADLPEAENTVQVLQAALDLGFPGASPGASQAWRPPVLKTIAKTGAGVPNLIEAIRRHREYLVAAGLWEERERRRIAEELASVVRDLLLSGLRARISDEDWTRWIERIAAREADVYTAANALIRSQTGGET